MQAALKYLEKVGFQFGSERYRRIFFADRVQDQTSQQLSHSDKQLVLQKILSSIPETLKLYVCLLTKYDPDLEGKGQLVAAQVISYLPGPRE